MACLSSRSWMRCPCEVETGLGVSRSPKQSKPLVPECLLVCVPFPGNHEPKVILYPLPTRVIPVGPKEKGVLGWNWDTWGGARLAEIKTLLFL